MYILYLNTIFMSILMFSMTFFSIAKNIDAFEEYEDEDEIEKHEEDKKSKTIKSVTIQLNPLDKNDRGKIIAGVIFVCLIPVINLFLAMGISVQVFKKISDANKG